jgi:hypothetical protein
MLCQYKDRLGVPGQGVHRHFFGVAVFDIVATLVLTELVIYVFHTPRVITLFSIILTGIVLHRIFCVRTTLDRCLFPDTDSNTSKDTSKDTSK